MADLLLCSRSKPSSRPFGLVIIPAGLVALQIVDSVCLPTLCVSLLGRGLPGLVQL